jgi:hypothetical protein
MTVVTNLADIDVRTNIRNEAGIGVADRMLWNIGVLSATTLISFVSNAYQSKTV